MQLPRGSLTELQYRVLAFRGKGLTQKETARELRTTRANVSMIELRARRKVDLASETLRAYKTTLTDHEVTVPKGTRMYDIPRLVLAEGDRFGVHLRSNIVEIVRMVKALRQGCVVGGRTTRRLTFVFNQGGRLRLRGARLDLGHQ